MQIPVKTWNHIKITGPVENSREILGNHNKQIRRDGVTLPHPSTRGDPARRLIIHQDRKGNCVKKGFNPSNPSGGETHSGKGGKHSIPIEAIIGLFYVYFKDHPRGVVNGPD